jgi:hypothetical protein
LPCRTADATAFRVVHSALKRKMRRSFVPALLFMVWGVAIAGHSFSERVHRAKLVEESPDGKAYQQVLWTQIGDYTAAVMQQCFKKGAKADTSFFALVGDVLPNRSLSGVEVKPKTNMSQCFADGFSRASFPQPSASFGEDGIPIEIDMKIKP